MDTNGFLPNKPVDQDAQTAHNFAADYDKFLRDSFGRKSYDGQDGKIVSYVHVTFPLWWIITQPNAMWSADKKVIYYSDGYSSANDVVFHELTHAVISSEIHDSTCLGLCYERQSGALNESFADVFGVIIDKDNWLIGEDLPLGFFTALFKTKSPFLWGNA